MQDSSSTLTSPLENIILVGFMGTGKSTIGREIKKQLGYHLVDTDLIIEEQADMDIPQIFSKQGEPSFRSMETELLKSMVHQNMNHHIIATGGGMAVATENQILLKKLGFVVWLSCSPENILERTSRTNNRPLLQSNNRIEVIEKLLNERTPLYDRASHIKIDTSKLNFDEIVCGIIESARYHFGTSH